MADARMRRSGMLAVGSYHKTVGVYMEGSGELMYVLLGQQGGVTQVQFSPDGNFLYSGARKDGAILCWDVRYTQECVYQIVRDTCNTNQRIGFDIDPSGRHLCTGGEDGYVRAYDLRDGSEIAHYRAAEDTVNGFSFHPTLNLGATASGHRRYETAVLQNEQESESGLGSAPKEDGVPARLWNSMAVWRFSYDWTGPMAEVPMDTEVEA
ncbi:hypothetical protein CYMTET_6608 [Cymbomonas tetramitiformis]|uniref:Uncharacterized protein n=1 Tax=Cymbomonas tetramitiformis TaxID=36881 RepID=A0AAE0GYM4_9CHLO|nr:hypothetical protein CYMTET_6608 [Cymbomonas tetramitiformis]